MKTRYTLLAVLIAAYFLGFSQAYQVPNGSFENWTTANGVSSPNYWFTTDDLILSAGAPLTTNVFAFEDLTTFTQGAASIKIVTDTVPGLSSQIGIVPGIASLGTGGISATHNPEFFGIPFTYRPDSLIFDFQYALANADSLDTAAVFISLTKQTSAVLEAGFALTTEGSWTHVAIPLATFYSLGTTPDTLTLQFYASNSAVSRIGSTLLVDGVRFGYINTPAPSITATIMAMGATTLCTGDSVMLMANTGTNYTYQWNLAGTAITGATSSTYEAIAAGSYTVTIDSASSSATSNAIVLTDSNCTLGINNIAATNLSVYPNPASSLLNINSNQNLGGYNLQMFDLVGRLVISQVLEGSNNAINVATLSNGTYIYRITDKETNVIAQSKFNVIK